MILCATKSSHVLSTWRYRQSAVALEEARWVFPSALSEDLGDRFPNIGRGFHDMNACRLHGLHLSGGGAFSAGDDGTGVAPCGGPGGGLAGDEADGLGDVVFDVAGGGLFGGAADLADHDDGFGLAVGLGELEHIDVRGPDDGVAADADSGRLADAAGGELVDGL